MQHTFLPRKQFLSLPSRQRSSLSRTSFTPRPLSGKGVCPMSSISHEPTEKMITRKPKSRKSKKKTLKEDLIEFVLDIRRLGRNPTVITSLQAFYLMSSLLFVVLYVWSTYSIPSRGSLRYNLDIALSCFFAVDYGLRILAAEERLKAVFSAFNLIDLLSFAPQLLEPLFQLLNISIGRHFQWFRIFRTMRVLRLCVIAVNLSNIQHLTTSALSSGALTVRIVQLFASIAVLLFTGASVIHLVEKMPWHNAVYFVMVTLTTVGYGDVVVSTAMGKIAVLSLMALGVVLIPVRATQVYEELNARKVVLGQLPRSSRSFVLVSKSLLDVRAFSDFYTEFFLDSLCHKYKDLKMVCLSKESPSYEFRVFQDANERRLTCVEGSVLTDSDLLLCQAHRAEAIFLLADRAAANDEHEDLNILFQVWSVKAYTKSNPLYVQVLRSSSISRILPFLDLSRDVIISLESIRLNLLILSCLCPGAPVLLGNLLRISHVSEWKSKLNALAGREWLRAYVNGCAYHIFETSPGPSFINQVFIEIVEFLKRSSQIVLIGNTICNRLCRGVFVGIMRKSELKLNPSRQLIRYGDQLILLAKTQEEADQAMLSTFQPLTEKDLAEESPLDSSFFEESECMPLFEGEFESESIDADDLPCIPLEQLEILTDQDSQDLLNYAYPEEASANGKALHQGWRDHIVLCGSPDSYLAFLRALRKTTSIRVVIITSTLEFEDYEEIKQMENLDFIEGVSTDKEILKMACVQHAKALLHVSHAERPTDSSIAVEKAVLTDSNGLLTAYTLPPAIHAVVELCHTSSMRFLNPGVLIRQQTVDEKEFEFSFNARRHRPRESWLLRRNQIQALREEGMTEWQANGFYAAGRVLVPALMSTFASHSFLNKGLLLALLTEFCQPSSHGMLMMDQVEVPQQFVGHSYADLYQYLTLQKCSIPIGLYRRKVENPAWRLHYVMTNPPGDEVVLSTDKVYVIRDGCS